MSDNKTNTPAAKTAEAKATNVTKATEAKAEEKKPVATAAPAQPAAKTSEDKKPAPPAKETKAGDKKPQPKDGEPKQLSALDAAAKVLGMTKKPMSCKELIGAMAAKGLWSSPNGKTPASTLYAAMLREITTKGKESRFEKVGPGRFALRKK